MKKFTTITWLMAILMLIAITPALATGLEDKITKAQEESIIVGQVPPDFTLTDMEGNEFTLSEMAGNKPVVIDFWATWCGWCITGFPNLVEFTADYGDEVEVVGVGVWMDPETIKVDDIVAFKEEHGLNFRLLLNWESDLAEKYFVNGIPMTVVVDKDGKVAALYSGYHETLKEDLVSLLDLE